MPVNKIFIPTFISSINYNPARVLPHVYFYNGLKTCEPYYFQGYSNGNTGSVISNERQSFPYFDNYEGQNPVSSSRSLLFFNEPAVYGTTPTNSLYSEYWENYINLLYNPRTRLINCEAIIPLADYFKMELNDICEWRGNYYHLRAINDYNLSNGECKLQLLGPILGDILPNIIPSIACNFDFTISEILPTTTTTTISPTTSTTSTTTTTTAPPPSGSCVDIKFNSGEEEYLNCGIYNLFNEYTASYKVNCTASNAPEDINVYITASASTGGTLIYTLTIPSGSQEGYETVYTREWTGTCQNRQSTTYSIIGINIDGYPSCSCDYNAFGNCGRGDTVGEACNDAVANARTFYSDCTAGTFGAGCVVYTTPSGTPLTGYTRIFMNGSNWDISSTTGVVSGSSSTQC